MPDRARSRTQSRLHDATLCKNYWQSHMLQQHTRLTSRLHQGYIKVSHWHVGMHAWTEEAFKVSVQRWQIKSLCLWVFLRWPWPSHIQPATSIEAKRSNNMALFGWCMDLLADATAWTEDRNISQLLDHEFVHLNLKCQKDNKHGNYKCRIDLLCMYMNS